jgi:GTP 3',8-cyclase
MMLNQTLKDGFNRPISYVRISVTDRCDLRCTYCMLERQTFLPKTELLSFEELERLSLFLISRGVERLRITGGEPLVRKGILDFLGRLGTQVKDGCLKELTLTTNGTLLKACAQQLADSGIKRLNVSLDSLKPDVFKRITRGGDVRVVLDGIEAAKRAGLKVKLNIVALRRDNLSDLADMIRFAHDQDLSVSLIETMPLGNEIEGREDQFVPLTEVMSNLNSFWDIRPVSDTTAGPARYFNIRETGGRLGLISPLSHNFCERCNRVRVTCTGKLYMCLGQDDFVDLRDPLRTDKTDQSLSNALDQALRLKPKAHDFYIGPVDTPLAPKGHIPKRTMSVTGG